MGVTYTFTGVPVSDYPAACDWYARLFGREADMFPHEREAVWRLTSSSAIYVVQDADRAGSALLTIALDDLNARERAPRSRVRSPRRSAEPAPRRLLVKDADGNTLTFFQDRAAGRVRPRVAAQPGVGTQNEPTPPL